MKTKKENNNENTLKSLGQVYSWIGLVCATYLFLFEDTLNFGLVLKMILVLSFMYEKHNWKMLTLCLSALTIIYSIFTYSDSLTLFDILGFSVIFWYALKYR